MQATTGFHHIKAGDFGLVRSDGPDVVWSVKPTPDPCEGLSEDEINALSSSDSMLAWFNDVDQFVKACREQLHLTTAYDIGVLCAQAGYNREEDGHLEHWLFHKMGMMLKGLG